MGPGYDIGASLANEAASELTQGGDDPTVFIFGNADNPGISATQEPTQTATTTATTAMPGSTAISQPVVTSGAGAATVPAGTAAAATSGLSTTTILLLAGLAVLAVHHFVKK